MEMFLGQLYPLVLRMVNDNCMPNYENLAQELIAAWVLVYAGPLQTSLTWNWRTMSMANNSLSGSREKYSLYL